LAPGEASPWHRDPFHRVTVVRSGDLLNFEFRAEGDAHPCKITVGEGDWSEPSDGVHRGAGWRRVQLCEPEIAEFQSAPTPFLTTRRSPAGGSFFCFRVSALDVGAGGTWRNGPSGDCGWKGRRAPSLRFPTIEPVSATAAPSSPPRSHSECRCNRKSLCRAAPERGAFAPAWRVCRSGRKVRSPPGPQNPFVAPAASSESAPLKHVLPLTLSFCPSFGPAATPERRGRHSRAGDRWRTACAAGQSRSRPSPGPPNHNPKGNRF
jgi:hypothetical protein